jgi:hypothetical protein
MKWMRELESGDRCSLIEPSVYNVHWPEHGVYSVKFKALLDQWQKKAGPVKTDNTYSVHLAVADAAQLHALSDLFPGRSVEDLITDLLHAGLEEISAVMPYQAGPKVISQDDHGDPVYEDIGLTPRFIELTRKHKKALQAK